jgi:hypothetical protein
MAEQSCDRDFRRGNPVVSVENRTLGAETRSLVQALRLFQYSSTLGFASV